MIAFHKVQESAPCGSSKPDPSRTETQRAARTARSIADELELTALSSVKSGGLCASVRLESSAGAAVARLELEMAGFVSELQPESGCRALSMNSQAQQPSDARDE
jgi:hypothetical protein